MNKIILMGRLTLDPELRYITGENPLSVATYTLAVPRRAKKMEEPETDFIPCVCFEREAEFAERYFRQGMKIVITGRLQAKTITKRDGKKVRKIEVVVEEQEFAESSAMRSRS